MHHNVLTEAIRLEAAGLVDAALDIIYAYVHSSMREPQGPEKLDALLTMLSEHDDVLLTLSVGVLAATFPWKHLLKARAGLVDRLKRRIRLECPARERELLGGLG